MWGERKGKNEGKCYGEEKGKVYEVWRQRKKPVTYGKEKRVSIMEYREGGTCRFYLEFV